jgi:membrane protease YdiL (CAAX protease family)
MSSVTERNRKNVVIVLIVYGLLCAFLALGSYLFARFPENEAPGGIVLGLTSLILGIIAPFHLLRTGVISFRFMPLAGRMGKVIVGLVLFAAFYLLLFPSGILWQGTTIAFFVNPPSAMTALSTFLSMLWATATYGFIFWGGLLHALKNAGGSVVAVLVTSFLFGMYHFSQFSIAPPTVEFLLMVFVGGLMLASFTLWARCVLPTLIVHQLGHFFYFATLQDNPFAEDLDRSVASLIMLLFLFGIYEGLFRLIKRASKGRGGLRQSQEGRADA